MTDATDIKALRDEMTRQIEHINSLGASEWLPAVWVTADDARFLISSLDQLEAERQRADDRAKENYRNKCDVDNCMETIANLEAELAALKGDQVPVAWILNNGQSGASHIERDKRIADLFEIFNGNEVVPLFTAPQKPVVLPPLANIHSNLSGEYLDKAGVIEAIEAAGCIVKDGE